MQLQVKVRKTTEITFSKRNKLQTRNTQYIYRFRIKENGANKVSKARGQHETEMLRFYRI